MEKSQVIFDYQMKKNIAYQTEQLARYFAQNRVKWQQFYESERVIIDRLNLGSSHNILDIGCGCGGLGLALREQFGVEKYTGVEINSLAADAGRIMNPMAFIFCGDILDLSKNILQNRYFDVVFSLSCVDWNVRFADMLAVAWERVLPGGFFVATFRLTASEGCNDMEKSYQYINYDGVRDGECAPYVVLNAKELIEHLCSFNPSNINAFGYWGDPSGTAVTPYETLCFAACTIQKRRSNDVGAIQLHLDLPAEILSHIGNVVPPDEQG
jgi:SAM-dependent methyltransferase